MLSGRDREPRGHAELTIAEPAITTEEIDVARRYAEAVRAASTQRAYAADWRRFDRWCLARGLDPLPADPRVIAVFLSAAVGYIADDFAGHSPPRR